MSKPSLQPSFAARTATFGALARPGLRALLEDDNKDGGAGSGAGTGNQGAGGGANTPPPANPDLDRLRKENEQLKAAQKKREDDEAAAADEKKKEAQKDGDLQTQLDAANAELTKVKSKLDELTSDASVGKTFRETEATRIAEGKKQLTEAQQKLVDAQPNVVLQGQLLNEFVAAKSGGAGAAGNANANNKGGGANVGGAGHSGGSPGAGGPVNFEEALTGGAKTWEAAKQKDPAGAAAWFANHMKGANGSKGGPLPFLARGAVAEKKD